MHMQLSSVARPLVAALLATSAPRHPALQLAASGADGSSSSVPQAVFAANAATKWVVTFAQTGAVVARRDLVAPYIVVGSIGAAFAAKAAKKVINQQRPDGAPFTDPGMPSSHALVATFAAVAWALTAPCAWTPWASALLAGAATVSVLRVVTGYHTWPQVLVGAGLGTEIGAQHRRVEDTICAQGTSHA